jgi:hypothetical protein
MSATLTERQRAALVRLDSSGSGRASTYWVSTTSSTKATYAALGQLERRGFVSCDRGGYWPLWSITDAGRAALSSSPLIVSGETE